jgi:F0F1-type ATP synthase membrane subunit b/b'
MPDASPSGEHAPLELLRGDEAELEHRLAAARRDAAAVVAAARGEAERIIAEAREGLEDELRRARAGAEQAAAREALRAQEAVAEQVMALARRAEGNRPRALARLLELVLGRDGP